jgi:hypothetical protein
MINRARGTDQLDRLSFVPVKLSFLLAVTKKCSRQIANVRLISTNVLFDDSYRV